MGIRVDISTTQDQYIAGGVVHGAVNVTCDEGGGTAADQKSAEAPLLVSDELDANRHESTSLLVAPETPILYP